MKRLILCLPCIICLFACGKENGFWQWKIDQENIMENVDFPHEGSLRLITSKEDTMQATLEFSYKNPAAGQLSDGEVCEAFVYFDFVGMPYQMKDNNSSIRLYANELPGLVRYSVMESGTDLYVINGIMGSFSFDTTLEFQTTLTGRTSMTPGDELHGSWVVRFESNEGERLLFRVSKVSVY